MPGQLFKGKTVNNQPHAHWKHIYAACKKHEQFIIEIRRYDEDTEISLQQMRWLHCKAGPIQVLAGYQGISLKEAQNELKRKCGRQWFVQIITEENCNSVEGQVFWECKKAVCNKLFHPVLLKGQERRCPYCGTDSIQLINIKSKTDMSVKKTTQWFTEMADFMDSIGQPIGMPDPRWQENNT